VARRERAARTDARCSAHSHTHTAPALSPLLPSPPSHPPLQKLSVGFTCLFLGIVLTLLPCLLVYILVSMCRRRKAGAIATSAPPQVRVEMTAPQGYPQGYPQGPGQMQMYAQQPPAGGYAYPGQGGGYPMQQQQQAPQGQMSPQQYFAAQQPMMQQPPYGQQQQPAYYPQQQMPQQMQPQAQYAPQYVQQPMLPQPPAAMPFKQY
jgi:hypothetical protein